MIHTFYKVVDEAIVSLGLNSEETKGEQPGQWNLKKGKFDIMVDVWEQEKQFLFQVVCPLCTLPDDNKEGFMLHLLQKHAQAQVKKSYFHLQNMNLLLCPH